MELDVSDSTNLTNLNGLEKLDTLEILAVKFCTNLTDFSGCLKATNLRKLVVDESQRKYVEAQLKDAPFEVVYEEE